jgi:cytochrome c-type biogenesis protein CcmH/NrfG
LKPPPLLLLLLPPSVSVCRALELEPGLVSALNNRAMARLKLEQWSDAEQDCSAVLAAEPSNVKALLRRAAARRAQGQAAAAAQDWRAVLRVEPRNREAAAGLGEAQGVGEGGQSDQA